MKVTVLVDRATNEVIDVNCSMKQPHDSQVVWQVLTRNVDRLTTTTADKGYDRDDLREQLRDHSIKTVIEHKKH